MAIMMKIIVVVISRIMIIVKVIIVVVIVIKGARDRGVADPAPEPLGDRGRRDAARAAGAELAPQG